MKTLYTIHPVCGSHIFLLKIYIFFSFSKDSLNENCLLHPIKNENGCSETQEFKGYTYDFREGRCKEFQSSGCNATSNLYPDLKTCAQQCTPRKVFGALDDLDKGKLASFLTKGILTDSKEGSEKFPLESKEQALKALLR